MEREGIMKKTVICSLAAVVLWGLFMSSTTNAQILSSGSKGAKILLPEGSELFQISPASSTIKKEGFLIRSYWEDCPVMVWGNNVLTIKDEVVSIFDLPITIPITDIAFLGGDCVFASGYEIYRCTESGKVIKLLSADAPVTRVLPDNKGILYSTGKSIVYCDYATKTGHILYTSKEGVILAENFDGEIFFACGKDFFLISGNEIIRLYSDKQKIRAMSVHPEGTIFYSTDKGTFMLTSDYRRLSISKRKATAINVLDDDLYLTFSDGYCAMISRASGYKNNLPKAK